MLGAQGREKRACAAEQKSGELAPFQLAQKISAQDAGTAAAAASAAMDILLLQIEDQHAAVLIAISKTNAIL